MSQVYNLYSLEPSFRNYLLAENVSAVTLKNYLSDLRHFLGWLSMYRQSIPQTDQFIFDKREVGEYITYLRSNNIPDSTLNRRLSTLRKFCTYCFNSQLIQENYLSKQAQLPIISQAELAQPQVNPIKHLLSSTSGSLVFIKGRLLSSPLVKYAIILILVIAVSGYFSLATLSKKQASAATTSLLGADRVLTFQGSLTDNLGNPVDSKTDVVFRMYTKPSGGVPIYIGKCIGEAALTPDIHGIFTTVIGTSCGMKKIPASLFIDNPNLYLGVTVGSDPEMRPRQKIANVGTAASAQSLAGLPLGTEINNVPYIDSQGVLALAAASPTIQSTSGTFTIKGSTLNLTTTSPTEGNINLSPAAGGNVFITGGNVSIGDSVAPTFKLQLAGDIGPSLGYAYDLGSPLKQWANIYGTKFYQNNYEVCDASGNCNTGGGYNITPDGNIKTANGSRWMPISDSTHALNIGTAGDVSFVTFDTLNSRVGIGTTAPGAKLNVSGSVTGKALTIFNETGDQNILVASASGVTKFILSRGGNLSLGQADLGSNRQIDTSSGAYLTSSGVWTDASSRAWKTDFTNLDYAQILNKVKDLSVTQWSYKSDSSDIKHIGPVAEDFYASFGLGNDSQHIASLDSAGIALAAVKGLALQTDDMRQTVSQLQDRVENLSYHGLLLQPNPSLTQNLIEEMNLMFNTLKSRYLESETILVKNSLEAKNITSDYLLALVSRIDQLTSDIITVREKISSPVIETDKIIASGEANIAKIKTNQISSPTDNLTIDLNNQYNTNSPDEQVNHSTKASNGESKGPLAQLIIKGLEGKTVASIDAGGNATFSGTLTADSTRTGNLVTDTLVANTASISGDLIARNVRADNIDALSNQVTDTRNTLASQSTNLQDLSNNINEVQRLLGELRNQPLNSENYQSLMQALTLSLNNVIQPTPSQSSTNVTPNLGSLENLTVQGSANIYKAGITDSLTVGNVFVRDNSILSLAWDLDISSLANVNFFGGMVTLHKDGSLIANGQVIAQGGIRTNTLSQVTDGTNIAVQLKNDTTPNSNPKLTIQDNSNQEVASINSQGEGSFKSLAIDKYKPGTNSIIAASDNFSRNGQFSPALETKSYSAGEGLLPGNNSQVVIYNDRIKSDSLVYLTSTSSDSSIQLSIVEKRTCTVTEVACRPYFKVGSDKPSPTPITFNWLLVN